ncbi:PHB depolymerase family esterase [Corynebacterium sp. Q4381]|uniref:alpha/beta hydrolase family esterase n=1 Tax=Corynebacterium sp. Marseille-Q4381 TaxID=3121597 RepID=UPI002FE6636D
MRPAIIALHGKGDNGPDFAEATGLTRADAVISAPTGKGLAWSPAPYAATTLEQDAARIGEIVDGLVANHEADPARIYLVGFSNGGGLAVSLSTMSTLGERFAGVASVSAAVRTTPDEIAATPNAVDYLNIHGTWDDVVPYAGETRSPYSGEQDDTTYGAVAVTEAFTRRNAGRARAEHIPVERMGHEWRPETTATILKFFGIQASL